MGVKKPTIKTSKTLKTLNINKIIRTIDFSVCQQETHSDEITKISV